MCSMIARSVDVASSVTRMVLYMPFRFVRTSTAHDYMPCRFQRIGQTIHVHYGDQNSTRPPGNQQKPTILPRAHPLARTREMKEREHREWQLQREDHLTQRQQIGHAT